MRRQHRPARDFRIPDEKGNWTGFDVDFCRAVAAAIFDDPAKVKFIPLEANERFKELQSRKIDILVAQLDLEHVARDQLRSLFPGRRILRRRGLHGRVPRARSNSALDLDDTKICVQDGTTTQLNLADYFRPTT